MKLDAFRARGPVSLAGVFFAAVLLAAGEPAAQVTILEPIQSLNRKVILRWTKATADTFTVSARREIPTLNFHAWKSQGYQTNLFSNGERVIGRGGGGSAASGFIIEVGNAEDLYPADEPPEPEPLPPFDIAGVFQFGRDRVGVSFTQPVDETTATLTANYSFSPALGVSAVRLQDNRQTAILETGPLLLGTSYDLTVTGVTTPDGGGLPPSGPKSFTTAAEAVTNIAGLHADPSGWSGQIVTVVGQVYIPTGSRGGLADGFIQDGSGRGIRLYDGPVYPQVNSRGNVVQVTGTLGTSPLQITEYTAVVLAGGQPQLGARVLSIREAQNDAWNSTFIETQGRLSGVDGQTEPEEVRYEIVSVDTLFAGYQIWRASVETPTDFSLLRTYSLLDSTWTFVGDERVFADPDSIILRGTERDPESEEDELLPGPFNGFGYHYAVTWFNAVTDATVFPFRTTNFDTLRGEEGVVSRAVFPSKSARVSTPLLGAVRVVPNPYNPGAPFSRQEFPGEPRIQFVNLPAEAKIRIYNVAGDLVRELDKTGGAAVDVADWDLTNERDEEVAAGIYVYFIRSGGETVSGQFVIVR